jgi:hypothetical protein
LYFLLVYDAVDGYRGDGPAKRRSILFALIFFASFLYQDKKEVENGKTRMQAGRIKTTPVIPV